ncbi:uncharacterized protein LOC107423359 [Ziziphus jujuba]|uniref:Uncharacterized protein LOC107423359 n=1 Tax=Ziziphus jujuba TaxID=326968 RepID=A0A6P4A3X3_ZIZJJ|nr:uncharacterized protein LOC107423359 [Ziziphus jujuba]
MGTEILRPQDCLIERIRVPPASFYRRKSYYGNPNPNPNPNPNFHYSNPRPNRKQHHHQVVLRSEKRDERKLQHRYGSEPSVSKRTSSGDLSAMKTMEKVTILRRGESLDSKIKSSEGLKKESDGGLVVCGTERLGPDPEMVPKQTRIVDLKSPPVVAGKTDVYAGSACAVSPAPSSLPLPSFSKKKQVFAIVDDSATRDLRRLLRLD